MLYPYRTFGQEWFALTSELKNKYITDIMCVWCFFRQIFDPGRNESHSLTKYFVWVQYLIMFA